jgi:hypothetical protein
MSYQTFHPDTGTTVVPIGRHSENNQTSSESTNNENRLYPFGKPVFLCGLSVQMGIKNVFDCVWTPEASKIKIFPSLFVAFVRKVWAIFTSELVVVTITAALFLYNELKSYK